MMCFLLFSLILTVTFHRCMSKIAHYVFCLLFIYVYNFYMMCRILSNKSKASLPYLVSSTEYHWMPLLYIHKKILPICHSCPQTVKINGTLHAKWHTKKAFFNEFMTNWCSVGVRFVIYKTLYTYIIFTLFTYPPCADTHILKYDAKTKKHIYDIYVYRQTHS